MADVVAGMAEGFESEAGSKEDLSSSTLNVNSRPRRHVHMRRWSPSGVIVGSDRSAAAPRAEPRVPAARVVLSEKSLEWAGWPAPAAQGRAALPFLWAALARRSAADDVDGLSAGLWCECGDVPGAAAELEADESFDEARFTEMVTNGKSCAPVRAGSVHNGGKGNAAAKSSAGAKGNVIAKSADAGTTSETAIAQPSARAQEAAARTPLRIRQRLATLAGTQGLALKVNECSSMSEDGTWLMALLERQVRLLPGAVWGHPARLGMRELGPLLRALPVQNAAVAGALAQAGARAHPLLGYWVAQGWKVQLGENGRNLLKSYVSYQLSKHPSLRAATRCITQVKTATIPQLIALAHVCQLLPFALKIANHWEDLRVTPVIRKEIRRLHRGTLRIRGGPSLPPIDHRGVASKAPRKEVARPAPVTPRKRPVGSETPRPKKYKQGNDDDFFASLHRRQRTRLAGGAARSGARAAARWKEVRQRPQGALHTPGGLPSWTGMTPDSRLDALFSFAQERPLDVEFPKVVLPAAALAKAAPGTNSAQGQDDGTSQNNPLHRHMSTSSLSNLELPGFATGAHLNPQAGQESAPVGYQPMGYPQVAYPQMAYTHMNGAPMCTTPMNASIGNAHMATTPIGGASMSSAQVCTTPLNNAQMGVPGMGTPGMGTPGMGTPMNDAHVPSTPMNRAHVHYPPMGYSQAGYPQTGYPQQAYAQETYPQTGYPTSQQGTPRSEFGNAMDMPWMQTPRAGQWLAPHTLDGRVEGLLQQLSKLHGAPARKETTTELPDDRPELSQLLNAARQ